MRPGDKVLYVAGIGNVTTVDVAAVSGAGDSGYKILAVTTAAGFTVRNVPNVRDSYGPSGYWCQEVAEVRNDSYPRAKRRAKAVLPDASDAEES